MSGTALIAGSSGIAGSALATLLAAQGWQVLGLARHPQALPGVTPVAADLQDPSSVAAALAGLRPSHLFFASWARQASEAENIRVNAGMVRNLLDAVRPAASVRHVALVTGLKHYLGPFEAYGRGVLPPTPFREEQPRLDLPNFYYAQEDEVFAAAARDGFGWSVHRPHTVIGKAVGNAMNMGTTLAVYASLCRASGQPFRFPGSPAQWNGLTDMTDARQLARHLLWAATTPAAAAAHSSHCVPRNISMPSSSRPKTNQNQKAFIDIGPIRRMAFISMTASYAFFAGALGISGPTDLISSATPPTIPARDDMSAGMIRVLVLFDSAKRPKASTYFCATK